MNPFGVILAGLLVVSAVSGGSSSSYKGNQFSSDSSEEYSHGYVSNPKNRPPPSQPKYRFNAPVKRYGKQVYSVLPNTFDARQKWKQCPSIGAVPDQGCCDSSYALVPTAVMSDRTCIATNGQNQRMYSSYDPIVCCKECALFAKDKCRGGDPAAVWAYWQNKGIVTSDCLPYTFYTSCLGQTCPLQCTPGSSAIVSSDKVTGLQYYNVNFNVGDIQAEIFNNGPVESEIDMYLDFANYDGKSVYQNGNSVFLGKHSVKIIGWGSDENNVPYWLIVNTFSTKWGSGGTAKFLRGRDHMGIETNVRAAMPNV